MGEGAIRPPTREGQGFQSSFVANFPRSGVGSRAGGFAPKVGAGARAQTELTREAVEVLPRLDRAPPDVERCDDNRR